VENSLCGNSNPPADLCVLIRKYFNMKKIILWTVFSLIAAGILVSCSDESDQINQDELSEFAMNYLTMRAGSQSAQLDRQEGALNQSFQNLFGNYMGMVRGRIAEDSTGNTEPGNPGDSTVWDYPSDTVIYEDPWISCATITETVNEDGSVTTITDYGDGCEEGYSDWKYRMWGAVISTYLYNSTFNGSVFKDVYYFDSEYDHYGGYYYYDSSEWEMNGTSHYEGESTYDTTNWSFSGWSAYEDHTIYRWNETAYEYNGEGKFTYDNHLWVTEYSDYEYTTGDDYYYKTSVLEPLVIDYSCTFPDHANGLAVSGTDSNFCLLIPIYISGVERIQYRQDGEAGDFIIDYGDGECDYIIKVTENGKTVTVNLAELWETQVKTF
jgi:hypothetical protein